MGSSVSCIGGRRGVKLSSVAVTADDSPDKSRLQIQHEAATTNSVKIEPGGYVLDLPSQSHSNKAPTEQTFENRTDVHESPELGEVNEKPGNNRNNDEEDGDGEEPTRSPRSHAPEADGIAEMFAHTAMSLGMDDQDLLFNLMYFSEGNQPTLGSVMNTLQTETLALHSENNTPYKLKPASSSAVGQLQRLAFDVDVHSEDKECQVCKDIMEEGCDVVQLPTCRHIFHEECLLRWVKLQGWCPVCRASLESLHACIETDPALERTADTLENSIATVDLVEDRLLRDAQSHDDKAAFRSMYDRSTLKESAKNLFSND